MRSLSAIAALCAMLGCSSGPAETALQPASPDAFAGVWRSVTPSLEFIRLTVHSKSTEKDVLAARLTFSGVAWEGNGRIEGDSLVAGMTVPGMAVPSRVLVARAQDAETLKVQLRPATAPALDLKLVREK